MTFGVERHNRLSSRQNNHNHINNDTNYYNYNDNDDSNNNKKNYITIPNNDVIIHSLGLYKPFHRT